MREKAIEAYLCREVKKLGGIAYKFTSPGRRSVPDRICLFPGGHILFVECKAPGKLPTDGQWREITRLKEMGYEVLIVDTFERTDAAMRTARKAYGLDK